MSSTTVEVTITIRDVNDEPPQFNQREYRCVVEVKRSFEVI